MQEATVNDNRYHEELGNRELLKFGFLRTQPSTPVPRFQKDGWRKEHGRHTQELKSNKSLQTILLGDSLIKGLSRYNDIWENFFGTRTLNCGIGGDKTENILW